MTCDIRIQEVGKKITELHVVNDIIIINDEQNKFYMKNDIMNIYIYEYIIY